LYFLLKSYPIHFVNPGYNSPSEEIVSQANQYFVFPFFQGQIKTAVFNRAASIIFLAGRTEIIFTGMKNLSIDINPNICLR